MSISADGGVAVHNVLLASTGKVRGGEIWGRLSAGLTLPPLPPSETSADVPMSYSATPASSVRDVDSTVGKLFIGGVSWDTTTGEPRRPRAAGG